MEIAPSKFAWLYPNPKVHWLSITFLANLGCPWMYVIKWNKKKNLVFGPGETLNIQDCKQLDNTIPQRFAFMEIVTIAPPFAM